MIWKKFLVSLFICLLFIPSIAFGDEVQESKENNLKNIVEQIVIIQKEQIQNIIQRSNIVDRAYNELGKPYKWGGCGPSSYDCSGLVSYCLTGTHNRIGTTSTFLAWERTYEPAIGDICVNSNHCGIYIGNGQMIHAPHSGDVVKISEVHSGMIFVKYFGL